MKSNSELKDHVIEELEWDARINGASIRVSVNEGYVALSGEIDSYSKKLYAERAARRVAGVKAVSNELKIKIPKASQRSDEEIKKAVTNIIKWNSSVDENRISIEVQNGWVTLEGSVDWEYQRTKARILTEDITGITGVTNLINVFSSLASPTEIKERINAAFRRNYYLSSSRIYVTVVGSKTILSGTVKTLAEKSAAERAAWSAPGITQVENEIEINFSEVFV